MSRNTDVIVVGAGHNGLVAAFYLARAGLSVVMLERRPFVGGAAITLELWPGYRFMPCAHITHGLHPKIVRDMRLHERGLVHIPRPFYPPLYEDGTYWATEEFNSPRNRAVHLTTEERSAVARYEDFKGRLRQMFAPYRLGTPPTLAEIRAKVSDTPDAEVLEQALTLRLSQLHERFLPTTVLRDRYANELGDSGRDPLGLGFAFAATDLPEESTGDRPANGLVKGGMGVVTTLMAEAAKEAGATILVEQEVEKFLIEGEQVVGVRTSKGDIYNASVVLSNMDPKRTFLQTCSSEKLEPEFRRRIQDLPTSAGSGKFLAVISEPPEWEIWDGDMDALNAGAIQLNNTWKHRMAAYDAAEAGALPDAPHLSVSIPSVLDASLAPSGYHTVSLWIPVLAPKLNGCTWDDAKEGLAERIIATITEYAPNFRSSLQHHLLRTPADLERENGLTGGCIDHVQHAGENLLWNRPLPELARYRAPLQGLYLCGAGQHPGGDVTGMPGHNAAHEVLKDLNADT